MDKNTEKSEIIHANQRIAPRLWIQIKFKYAAISLSGIPGGMLETVTKNISATGLLFTSKEQFPLDTEFKIVLDMPGLPHKTLEIAGKVVRIEKIFPSLEFDIGVNFFKITDSQKEEITRRIERMNIVRMLEKLDKTQISDLHLTVNSPPMVRSFGQIKPLDNEPLSVDQIKQMIYSILTEEQKKRFEREKDLSFSFSPMPDSRYRVSVYQQRGGTEVVFRSIIPNIKTREELGLPDIIDELSQFKDGIVIIAGTTGSGKTTTITTMMDSINKGRGGVILSLENPIEYLHKNVKGIVKQRELETDVLSFAAGLKAALRQDPDVIVVGEILDPDTMEIALQASETGHLVVTSIHATDTVQVFDRLTSLFTAEQRGFVCARLSHSIRAVIVQKLIPHKSGVGRVLATETCVANIAVKRTIYNGDFTQLPSIIQTGSKFKMQLMQNSIDKLFEQGLISGETYEIYSNK